MIPHGHGDWEDAFLVPSFAIGLDFGDSMDESAEAEAAAPYIEAEGAVACGCALKNR